MGESQDVLAGKFGRTKPAQNAMKMVMEPSMMKSQRQASKSWTPLRPEIIPAVINPEKAPEIREPE